MSFDLGTSPKRHVRGAPRRGWPGKACAVCVVAAVAVIGCSSNDVESSRAERPQPTTPRVVADRVGAHAVLEADDTLVDATRPTRAHGGRPELPSRTLPIHVWYPKAPSSERFPLIVFSHGSTRRGVDYAATLSAWASAGYVVVAPDFPLSKTGTPGGTDYGDIESQAHDVPFVIGQVLDSARDTRRPWAALVDGERIGLGGQSMGAITTVAVAINPCCVDRRVDAITEFAGAWAGLGSAGPIPEGGPPALLVHGSADPVVAYSAATALMDTYPGPRRLLTLVGSAHDPGFFKGLGDPLDALVTNGTVAFYDQHLKDDPDAAGRLESLVGASGPQVATLSPTSGAEGR